MTEKLGKLGVAKHIRSVRKVPSNVEVSVVINKRVRVWHLRANITAAELDNKLNEVTNAWELFEQGQRDIEDAL